MKTILCYGDSNTWGYNAVSGDRFDYNIRWTTRLADLLGQEFRVIDEGLCGRTTVFDDPLTDGLNGLTMLEPVIKTHSPLDLLVVMLGTNDCKGYFGVTARNIGEGLRRLVLHARFLGVQKILVVTPVCIDPRIYETETAHVMGKECSEKSMRLHGYYKEVAAELGLYHIDANESAAVNTVDFMHFDEQSQLRFAHVLAAEIKDRICCSAE